MRKLLATIPDPRTRASLGASTVDGGLWALMYGFSEYFILPFAIFFGADSLQTSLVQGMGQLGTALAQLLGAALVARLGRRKRLTRITVALHALSWGMIIAVSLATRSTWGIVGFFALGLFANSLGNPGWLSWMNDLVPPTMRGAFWGKRNMVMGLVQVAAIGTAGLALRYAEPRGLTLVAFVVLFSIATLARGGGVYALGLQHEPPMVPEPASERVSFPGFLASLPKSDFGIFVLFSVLTTFSVNIMGPVFPVFLLKTKGLDYFEYTMVTMISMVLSYLAMSYWGPMGDRFGNRRILVVTAAALPLLAFGWIFASSLPVMILLQILSGFAWAGVNLSTTNFIFDSTKGRAVASTMANFNALTNICAFAGSLTGGLVATAVAGLSLPFLAPGNLVLVFALSGLLRLVVFLCFARRIVEVRAVEASPSITHLYIWQPFTLIVDKVKNLAERGKEEP